VQIRLLGRHIQSLTPVIYSVLSASNDIYSILSHSKSNPWTCFREPKNVHIFKSVFLPLKSINPTSTAFSAILLFIPCYQYATLNVEREAHPDVWSVFFVLSVRGDRSSMVFMGYFCSRKKVNSFCSFAGISRGLSKAQSP